MIRLRRHFAPQAGRSGTLVNVSSADIAANLLSKKSSDKQFVRIAIAGTISGQPSD